MNDIERAIKQFKEWEKDRWRLGKSPSIPTLILARQALEKQLPKKAYYLNYGGYNVGNWNHGIACICDYKASYCRHCGQKLDWR